MKSPILLSASLLTPLFVFGAEKGIETTIDTLGNLVSSLIPIAFAAALLFFFYGLAMFILKSGEDKEKAKGLMIWGVIALFIMTSIMGIIQFLGESIGVNTDEKSLKVPTVNTK